MDALPQDGRTALVIAHPGHELRVHGLLERLRPRTYVLTDGSGAGGAARVASTMWVLWHAGARRGEIFCPFTDAAFYAHLREGRGAALCQIAHDLADAFLRHDIRAVIGDASDRYNPAHDVCRLLIDAAVQIAAHRGVRVANYDFLLVGPPDKAAGGAGSKALRIDLDAHELRRKLAAARGYPEMAQEVAAALAEFGADAFRHECLRPVTRLGSVGPQVGEIPAYERYGAQRVATGRYEQVIRYRTHVQPLADRLRHLVEERAA